MKTLTCPTDKLTLTMWITPDICCVNGVFACLSISTSMEIDQVQEKSRNRLELSGKLLHLSGNYAVIKKLVIDGGG